MPDVFTREAYMATYSTMTPAERAAAHRRYYAQFVTPGVLALVRAAIGLDRITASVDPHMNDIPLKEWDQLDPAIRPGGARMHAKLNGACFWSLSDTVCVAKEAARHLKERNSAK
jgi:hypothetical protein